jgi:hypothetical protein
MVLDHEACSCVAGSLLVAEHAEQHIAGRRYVRLAGAQEGREHHRHAALHVQRAASPDEPVGDLAGERRSRPPACRRHDVDVALHEERGRDALAWQAGDEVGALRILRDDAHACAGVGEQRLNPLDAGALVAGGRVEADQPLQQLDRPLLQGGRARRRGGHDGPTARRRS